ncbi:MAG: type III-B CRISPR module-associated Cmr3 family protein [Thermoanaerobaculum sp.]
MTAYLFLKPLDVLFFRGNEAFGDTGQHGEALMPPWPSVFSGALRSAILAADPQTELALFSEKTREEDVVSQTIRRVIGTPRKPGRFRISFVSLGTKDEIFLPAPGDLLVWEHGNAARQSVDDRECPRTGRSLRGEDENAADGRAVTTQRRLKPLERSRVTFKSEGSEVFPFSFPSELSHVVAGKLPKGKPASGWWLKQKGLEAYLRGETPEPGDFIHWSKLWREDFRLGIARSRESYTAEEGRIYTTVGVALAANVGFVVGVEGVEDEQLPRAGVVRLGGDGRGAELLPWEGRLPDIQPSSEEWLALCVTPCVSPLGWKPPGVREQGGELFLGNARLVGCSVARAQVVSGWDLAAHQPKPAQPAIPPGSVFYFKGPKPETPPFVAGLEAWLASEKEPKPAEYVWRQRLAEGFNLTLIGVWPKDD